MAVAAALYQPLNEHLPPPPPARSLPAGFSLFPGQQCAPETAGDRALREIRTAKANRALGKFGLRDATGVARLRSESQLDLMFSASTSPVSTKP